MPARPARSTRRGAREVLDRFHEAHRAALRLRLPRRPAARRRVGQPAGLRHRPDRPAGHPQLPRRDGDRDRAGRAPATARGVLRRRVAARPPIHRRPTWPPGDTGRGPGGHRGVRIDAAGASRLHGRGGRFGNLDACARVSRQRRWTGGERSADPVLVEIVEGTLAVGGEGGRDRHRAHRPLADDPRRARLPGGHPRRRLRKLTGRSYSRAGPAVVRDFPIETMQPGRRLLPQRRLPVRGRHRPPARPVRHRPGLPRRARWSRSCRRSGTTTTSAARCPARCPRTRRSVFEEGLMVPPIKLWDAGVPNEAALTHHDPQLADARLAGRRPGRRVLGLPDGRAAAGRAVRPLRPRGGRGLLRRDHRQDHRDVPQRAAGQDPRGHVRVGGLRRARRRRRAAAAHPADHPDRRPRRRRAADHRLHRHVAAGQGADQPRGRLRRRRVPEEVAGADPAQPRRHPRTDGRAGRQRGRRPPDRDEVPARRGPCSPRSSRRPRTPGRS